MGCRFQGHFHDWLLCSPPTLYWFGCLFHTRELCRGGGDGSCGTSMLNMAASCFSVAVFSQSCGMGLYGAGVTKGVHKVNTKLSLLELWTTLMCVVLY